MSDLQEKLKEARLRSDALLVLLNKFAQARTEKQILEAVLQVGSSYLGVKTASFLPYDEWGASLPALSFGNGLDGGISFVPAKLSRPETRQVCKNCVTLQGDTSCVLLTNFQEKCLNTHVHCFPLTGSGRQVGVFNFFFEERAQSEYCEEIANQFFGDILGAAGQALENIRSFSDERAGLRSRMLQQPETFSSQLDISGLLDNFLLFARSVIDGDFAILYLPGGSNLMELESSTPLTMWSRKRSSRAQEIYADGIEDILEQVKGSGISRQVDHVLMDFDSSTGRESVWAAPIFVKDGHIVGVLIIGPLKQQALNEQQRLVIDSISGIAALSIQYKELFVQVEYQSVVEERMRLAREMHDGLAQTLAFLKIQASQMQNYLAIGENGKLAAMLQANHRTLADAYVDARQAIDDLRRIPAGKLSDWLSKVAADYRQATLQAVDVRMADLSSEIPANTQAQLIRIVQEALSNVRKHAAASSVRIDGTVAGETLLLEIQDDGCGFTPQSVDGNSRYGLMGMRERAESIGADFQISSEPGLGTVVSLRIPLTAWQERRGDVEHSA